MLAPLSEPCLLLILSVYSDDRGNVGVDSLPLNTVA